MKLVALSRAKSIKLNTLPQPEEIEEVASKEEQDEEEPAVSADSSAQISSEVNTLSGAIVATNEEVSTADVAPAAKDPALEDQAANEDDADEGFATVEIAEEAQQVDVELRPEEVKVAIKSDEVEVVLEPKEVEVEVEVESEPEEEFAQVVEMPSAAEDNSSKSSSKKKSKWSKKMRGFLAKK